MGAHMKNALCTIARANDTSPTDKFGIVEVRRQLQVKEVADFENCAWREELG
jgi:hypothetical protein